MWIERLEKLESLMNGASTNEKIYMSRILPTVIRTLKQDQIHEHEIRIVAKIISNGFSEKTLSEQNESTPMQTSTAGGPNYGFRIIHEVFSSNQITDQRLNYLVKVLSEDPKIYLTPEEIKKVESDVKNGSKQCRSELVKHLQKKSKQIIEWMNTDLESLEKQRSALEEHNDEIRESDMVKLYEIMLKKTGEDKSRKSGMDMFELIQKIQEHGEGHVMHTHQKYIITALKRSLLSGELEAAEQLWDFKKEHPTELRLMYSLLLLDGGKLQKSVKILSDVKKLPEDQVLIKTMESCVIHKLETLEVFINLVGKQFLLNNLTKKRLMIVVKKIEMKNLIKSGNLAEAFKMFAEMTSMLDSAFGQNDLMVACVKADQPELLKKVFNTIAAKHDKVTAIVDMMVTFLECNKLSKAEQLYKRSKHASFYINSSKLTLITERECDLNRPDVLHHLFLLVNNPDQISTVDLFLMLEKTINMYSTDSNQEGLKRLQHDVNKLKFNLDRKLKAHLDGAIVKMTKTDAFNRRLSHMSSTDDMLAKSLTRMSLTSNLSSNSDEKDVA